jgi:predicted RNase H-like HicB family nuclease
MKRKRYGSIDPMKRFLVIFEQTDTNFSAYSLDLPGCIATGSTKRQTAANMRQAIQMHLEGLREERLPLPRSRV